MNTQISFKIDSDLKDLALKKAKKDGFSLKAIVVSAMRDYVSNRYRLGMVFDDKNMNITETETDYDLKDFEKMIDFREFNEKGISHEELLKYFK